MFASLTKITLGGKFTAKNFMKIKRIFRILKNRFAIFGKPEIPKEFPSSPKIFDFRVFRLENMTIIQNINVMDWRGRALWQKSEPEQ